MVRENGRYANSLPSDPVNCNIFLVRRHSWLARLEPIFYTEGTDQACSLEPNQP